MKIPSIKLAILIGVVASTLGGCSFGGTPFQSPEHGGRSVSEGAVGDGAAAKQAAAVELRALKSSAESHSAIEVLWEVPAEPVEGFIVRYGDDREALTVERRLAIADIERIDDPVRGRLYRYVIDRIPISQRVFLTIAAVTGAHESPPSKVFEVSPGEPE